MGIRIDPLRTMHNRIFCTQLYSFQYLFHQMTPRGNDGLLGQFSGISCGTLQLPAIFSSHKQSIPEWGKYTTLNANLFSSPEITFVSINVKINAMISDFLIF